MSTTATNEIQLSTLLNTNGFKINSKSIVLQPALSTKLNQAQQLSNFDSVYGSLLSTQLQNYRSVLIKAYQQNNSMVIKRTLSADYKNAGLLITMLNSSTG
jgi:hypothetical protein